MQIIIPMSGTGERFKRAGYAVPKMLIEIEGRPIIAHVIDLFPGETDFLFICNRDHLADASLKLVETIRHYCPIAKIIGIAPHKAGPVHAVLAAVEHIKPDKPALVSYCDYGAVWDYARFKKLVVDSKCDGAVVGYTGFHPHMLRNHRYGYVQMKDERVTDIREKQPYTDAPMNEIALCGAYYFSNARAMLDAMRELEKHPELRIEGEHYVSLAYRFMLAKGADIRTFLVDYFMQWGTPEDLKDYLYWSGIFHMERQERVKQPGILVMPMAGRGQRFVDAGYKEPKPLIPIAGTPMAAVAWNDLPETSRVVAVLRKDLPQLEQLQKELPKHIDNLDIVMLDGLTEGQALSALAALDGVPDDAMVTIAACDNGLRYSESAFEALLNDKKVDVIVWGARGYPPAVRKPQAYGWILADTHGKIKSVSVKLQLDNSGRHPVITGTFTFRRAGDFRLCVKHMMERNARVNGEFYIDSTINDAISLNLNCHLFEVDHYIGWGTPDELKTYQYWQKCFDRWPQDSSPQRGEMALSGTRLSITDRK